MAIPTRPGNVSILSSSLLLYTFGSRLVGFVETHVIPHHNHIKKLHRAHGHQEHHKRIQQFRPLGRFLLVAVPDARGDVLQVVRGADVGGGHAFVGWM